MKYLDIRDQIKSGDLIAQSHGDWFSWQGVKVNLVRMFTKSTYSHVGIAWVIGGRVFMLEAVRPKLRIYPMSKIGDFYLLNMNAPWSKEAEEFALQNIGENYSQLTAIQAFFKPLSKDNIKECAAFAIAVQSRDGIDLGDMAIPDAVVKKAMEQGATNIFVFNK